MFPQIVNLTQQLWSNGNGRNTPKYPKLWDVEMWVSLCVCNQGLGEVPDWAHVVLAKTGHLGENSHYAPGIYLFNIPSICWERARPREWRLKGMCLVRDNAAKRRKGEILTFILQNPDPKINPNFGVWGLQWKKHITKASASLDVTSTRRYQGILEHRGQLCSRGDGLFPSTCTLVLGFCGLSYYSRAWENQ